ncbi:DNA mismatch repair protein MutT [Labrys miyagiensis]|uniref:DNA mismatch repair protein MutT n=1 Tax=Labrys miyagiensis TaxID=346912 RepID=A0ABQ6CGM0_9HYPH|nr:NUDIX domain-containing protein [Labrys miyagiensis]GLS19366.1 DNA mismatch repair protein MutT [Labrys miyagiensis]
MKTILIAAALVLRGSDETLLVRKRGSTAFMQPGGKIEDGESPAAALVRELKEEIGLTVEADELAFFGRFEAMAANEAGQRVRAEVFLAQAGATDTRPTAEIEEVRWISISAPGTIAMAPLTEHQILPAYRRLRAEAS